MEIAATAEVSAAEMEQFAQKQAEIRAKQMEAETQKMEQAANIDVAALSPEAAEEAVGEMTSMLLKSLGGLAEMGKKEENTDKDPMVAKVNLTSDPTISVSSLLTYILSWKHQQ